MHLGKIKQVSKSKKIAPRTKIALELLHHILGYRFTRSLMAGYNANVCKDFELTIYSDPFCTSCQIFPMNKKAISRDSLNPKARLKWVYGYYYRNSTKTFDK